MKDLESNQITTDAVAAGVAAGDRQRRLRDLGRQVWQIAPAVAAAALLAAVGRRWMGWSPLVPFAILAGGSIGLALFVYLSRRPHPATDEVAGRLDADAGLKGELRSAAWFSARDGRDAWTDLHLRRAAERLRDVQWAQLYPPVPAARARVATTVMMVAAIGLTITLPVRSASLGGGSAASTSAPTSDAMKILELSPELQRKLQELLSSIEMNNLSAADAAAVAGDLKNLLAKLSQLDPETLKNLEKAAAANAGMADAKKMDAKALAERAKRDADSASLPAELKKALQDVANQLDKPKKSENAAGQQQDGPPGPAPAASDQQPAIQPTASADAPETSSMQMAREASAGAGAPQMMMASTGAQSNDPNPGHGNDKNGAGAGKLSAIEQALKHELVEAASDQLGDNVTTDIHRKTEQGHATASFTGASAATFDRGHASAPPPVPDARRAQVQTYFIRKQ